MINIALILTKALSNKYIYSVFRAVPNLNLGTTFQTYWWLHWWMSAQMSLHLGTSETENKNLIFIISLSLLSTLIKCSLSPAASVGCKECESLQLHTPHSSSSLVTCYCGHKRWLLLHWIQDAIRRRTGGDTIHIT